MLLRVIKALAVGIPVALLLGFYAVPHTAAESPSLTLATEPPPAAPQPPAPQPPATPRPGGHTADGDIDPNSRPGPEHQRLTRLAGRYTSVSRASVPGNPEPMESRGEAIFKSTLGGRFLAQEEAGQMLGMPFEASKLWGYNTQAGQFESVWMYTGSTAMMVLRGKASETDEPSKGTIVLSGDVDGHEEGPFRVVLEEIDGDRFRVRLTGAVEGDGGPVFETVYTRKK